VSPYGEKLRLRQQPKIQNAQKKRIGINRAAGSLGQKEGVVKKIKGKKKAPARTKKQDSTGVVKRRKWELKDERVGGI